MAKSNSSSSDVEVHNLGKSYGPVKAIEDISFSVNKGELFGLIGPDGAGKSTTFRILTSLLLPDQGSAQVVGWDVVKDYKAIRREVGYMPGKFSLYQDLSVEENLNFFASIFGTTVSANYHLIEDIYKQIEPFRSRRAGKLSGGMKQKLALCCALIHKPAVLFLDEPTTGVDTVSRKEFWTMLQRIKNEGITIVVSTPYMDEAVLCDRIALIQQGRLLSVDSPEKIISQYPHDLLAIKSDRMSRLLTDLRNIPFVTSCNSFGEFHHITLVHSDDTNINRLKSKLSMIGHSGLEVHLIKPTIEDCFIQLMK